MFTLQRTSVVLAALALTACASAGQQAAHEALRTVDGDVAVMTVYVRGDDVEASLAVARRVAEQVVDAVGPRARPRGEVLRAIAMQLEGASLLPERRHELLVSLDDAGAKPSDGLAVLRRHRAATVVDRELRLRARALFLEAATEAAARGEDDVARALLAELRGWLSYTVTEPGELEVPSAVLAAWRAVDAEDDGHDALYRQMMPFLSLLPHGQAHAALASVDPLRPSPDAVEQAARLGLALRVDTVILAGVVGGEARAYVVDVLTRSLVREWTP